MLSECDLCRFVVRLHLSEHDVNLHKFLSDFFIRTCERYHVRVILNEERLKDGNINVITNQ